jgi:hypothetical protein
MKCLLEKCDRSVYARGLCCPCYNSAFKQVASGKVTWEQLISKGLANEVKHGGPGCGIFLTEFSKQFTEVK